MTEQPLRILCVINLPPDPRLGANRVWLELAKEWRAAGHSVEYFTLNEAFRRATSRNAVLSWRQIRFTRRAARFIRKNAGSYDVIDSLLGTLPFAKTTLEFHGLLVARSVGLYWLYEKCERQARLRWNDIPRGKLTGRIYYNAIRRHILRSSAAAIRQADLLNLPNEDELKSLREDLHSTKPAIVEPYGLTEERRHQLLASAACPEVRLASATICFVGMWSVRKGSRDLGEVVRQIRRAIPSARFRFLGTFTAEENVLRDLGLTSSDGCETIPQYEPGDLPELLRDCTAGVFPSYVEGFGFGLLEQLAAGIPTVAYDAPGPRQILAAEPDLLVPAGDTAAMAARIIKILQLPTNEYTELRERSVAVAKRYSWREIARATIDAYRAALRRKRGRLICTQPFGWRSPGGGARIMRALLQDAPLPLEIICTSPVQAPPQNEIAELHIPLRPYFGRMERSRFAGYAYGTAPLFARRFTRRLEQVCRNSSAIHAIAHGGLDFLHAFHVARATSRPFFLHVHDDFLYTTHDRRRAEEAMALAWSGATARFVISDSLGEEYQRRYGMRDYVVVTDGVNEIAAAPRPRAAGKLRVYFMGLFHLEYSPNLRALLTAMDQLRREGACVSLSMRCGSVPRSLLAGIDFAQVLPFADETQVARDLAEADLLYLPLPFDAEHAAFVRFSLSTKLVTYVASGVPILYHGPAQSAVSELLAKNDAALRCHSLYSEQVMLVLRECLANAAAVNSVAQNALQLARSQFSLPAIRKRFWRTIQLALAP